MAASRFARYRVNGSKTRDFEIFSVEPNPDNTMPVLTGRLAGEQNAPYFAAVAKIEQARMKLVKEAEKNKELAPALKTKAREEDAEILAEHVLTGWANVQDDDEKEVSFSRENAADFLISLPDQVWLDVLGFFRNPQHFTNSALTRAEAQAVGNG